MNHDISEFMSNYRSPTPQKHGNVQTGPAKAFKKRQQQQTKPATIRFKLIKGKFVGTQSDGDNLQLMGQTCYMKEQI